MYAPYIKQYEPMAAECQHFIDCIKTGAEPESGGEEALMVVQILEASSKSLENNGGIVPVQHPAE
jgi:predicted dehydrogenase